MCCNSKKVTIPANYFKPGFVKRSYSRGIKSLNDYDSLVSANSYPLNALSSEGQKTFRDRLRFMTTQYGTVVNGIGMAALDELGYNKYVELIKLITGTNPMFNGILPPYDPYHDIGVWVPGYEPRHEDNDLCHVAGGSMCWVPINSVNMGGSRF